MKKLKKTNGESVAETLVAVLLMSLAFLMLAGAVVTAARINDRAKQAEKPIKVAVAGRPETVNITIYVNDTEVSSRTAGITLYHGDDETDEQRFTNGYSYYEYAS